MNYALRVVTPVVVLTAACSSGFHPPPARPAAERSAQAAASRMPGRAAAHRWPTRITPGIRCRRARRAKPATPRAGAPAVAEAGPTAGEQARPALEAFGRAPLAFEAHQTDADVYVSHTPAYTLHVGPGLRRHPAGQAHRQRQPGAHAPDRRQHGDQGERRRRPARHGELPDRQRPEPVAHRRRDLRRRSATKRSTRASTWSTTAPSAKSNTTSSSRPARARAASRSASTASTRSRSRTTATSS